MTTSNLHGIFQELTADLELIKSRQQPSSLAVNYKTRKEGSKDVQHWSTCTPEPKLYGYRIQKWNGKICMYAEELYIHSFHWAGKVLHFHFNKRNHLGFPVTFTYYSLLLHLLSEEPPIRRWVLTWKAMYRCGKDYTISWKAHQVI